MYRWAPRTPRTARVEVALDGAGATVAIVTRFPARHLDAPWTVLICGDRFVLDTGPLDRDEAKEIAEQELTRRTGQAWS